ncbi:RES family NAD+ phosphorylase [Tahibacter amnicola]|uniref:RES family NAD+ phosphorylase n=1 Tax=Tahibacter amnicola TaxID=2976241 RepID=A0ABY6BKL2_9GAMM|nr:RES family NAD+ phosphorylase [Tahibacter amnicola]UXI70012.1 RES family NAD+ phosphorylase [Tahibacter amnicola]
MIVWRIIRKEFAATPLSVEGAKLFPGRWHSAGTPILYTASTESLALLEKFVHLSLEYRTILHVKLEIALPDDAVVEQFEDQPHAADASWEGDDPSTSRAVGDRWARHSSSLGLSVPSVLSTSERNVLLRANSPQFGQLQIVRAEDFLYDDRMWKSEQKIAAKRQR